MRPQAFPKRRRVRARGDFVGIPKRGQRFSRGAIVVIAARSRTSQASPARLGLVVSRKVGNAVERNKLKRWVRDWFRKTESLPSGLDFLVIAKPGSVARGHVSLIADLEVLSRAVRERLA